MNPEESLIGVAALSQIAFAGVDLAPLLGVLLDRVDRDPDDANALMNPINVFPSKSDNGWQNRLRYSTVADDRSNIHTRRRL
jgi:hypothetical protein